MCAYIYIICIFLIAIYKNSKLPPQILSGITLQQALNPWYEFLLLDVTVLKISVC